MKEHDIRIAIVDAAERLFDQIGFQETTVADIAHILRMSPAKVYRFFTSKAEIQEAVGRRLLSEVEAAVDDIVQRSGPASKKLHATIALIEKANTQRFQNNRKLHELFETAFNENWTIVHEHRQKIEKSLTEIMFQGNREGEFHVEESDDTAILVHSVCFRFCHPRLLVECAHEAKPTIDQLVNFCLTTLRRSGPTRRDEGGASSGSASCSALSPPLRLR
jgi:AcrR family transcriptional regulator